MEDVRELWIVLHGYGELASTILDRVAALDDGSRLIVAPEALSRFYDASNAASHREAPVGASWMTREERAEEIDDYIGWLQLAYESFAGRLAQGVPLHVLGFSQGAAAASRWVASGRVPATRLICWGAGMAPELDIGADSALRRARILMVIGDRDRFVSRDQIDAERARLDAAGFPYAFRTFSGGHRLDDATLRSFAAERA